MLLWRSRGRHRRACRGSAIRSSALDACDILSEVLELVSTDEGGGLAELCVEWILGQRSSPLAPATGQQAQKLQETGKSKHAADDKRRNVSAMADGELIPAEGGDDAAEEEEVETLASVRRQATHVGRQAAHVELGDDDEDTASDFERGDRDERAELDAGVVDVVGG